MPDTLSLSSGVSLGLLAGIVSGVCYLMANGITWNNKPEEKVVKKKLQSSSSSGICVECGGDLQGGVLPCICIYNSSVKFEKGAWFLRQAQRALSLMPWSISTEKLDLIEEDHNENHTNKSGSELQNVREFLENLSSKLAGGPIEGVKVAPLYNHPACLQDRNRPSSTAAAPTASSAHAALKRLVARVVEEASAMPALAQYASEPAPDGSEGSTYEDLLATAILNKVIERYQTENGSGGRSSSGIHSASASPTTSERSSPRSLRGRARESTPPLQEEEGSEWDMEASDEALDLPRRVPFPEFGGDIIHGTEDDDRDLDDASGSDLQAADGSWEENWLFQRKKIKSIQSVPVPMLVPNSNADFRVLIGDRDADETTDLSDNNTDVEEEEIEYKSDIKKVLDSQHVIGGKHKLDGVMDFEPESITDESGTYNTNAVNITKAINNVVTDAVNDEVDSSNINKIDTVNMNVCNNNTDSALFLGVDSGPLDKAEFSVKEEIHRNLRNGFKSVDDLSRSLQDAETVNLQRNKDLRNNTLNGHEREGEYEETVTVPVQRYADSLRRKHFEDDKKIGDRKIEAEDPFPGSIADRERKKWLNYVEMPNNPYSPEAIQKRLSARSTSSIFDTITKGEFEDKKKTKDVVNETNRNITNNKLIKSVSVNSFNETESRNPNTNDTKTEIENVIPEYKRYGRDYYIKEAKTSSGARKRRNFSDTCSLPCIDKSTSLDNIDSELASTGLLIQQFNTIATNQTYENFTDKKGPYKTITLITNDEDDNVFEKPETAEQTIFSAKPVIVQEETSAQFDGILNQENDEFSSINVIIENKSDDDEKRSPKLCNDSPNESLMSTSSLDDSIKIYNVKTGKIMKGDNADSVSERYGENKQDSQPPITVADTFHRKAVSDVVPVIIKEIVRENQLDSITEEEIQLPKVKELAKKFFSMDDLNGSLVTPTDEANKIEEKPIEIKTRRKSKDNILSDAKPNKLAYMHSLTARSISREFREELRLSMPRTLKIPGGANEVPDGTDEITRESSRPGSPLPEPGTLKTKLAFFEGLRAKFSSK